LKLNKKYGNSLMGKYKDLDVFEERGFLTEEERDELLKRESRILALKRIEESARTEKEFYEVIDIWNRLDDNRERKERAHEIGRPESILEWNSCELPNASIFNYDKVLDAQRQKGDYIDTIYDNPKGMCQLVTNGFLTGIIDELKQSRKELIYYLIIRDYTTSEYAQVTKTTDRNVRGTRKTAINKVRKEFDKVLKCMEEQSLPLTIDERYFLKQGVRKEKT
jgi:hypothetical protein